MPMPLLDYYVALAYKYLYIHTSFGYKVYSLNDLCVLMYLNLYIKIYWQRSIIVCVYVDIH